MNCFLEHLGLAARNPTALKDWYVKTLDAKLALDPQQTPPAYFVSLGGLILEIYQSDRTHADTGINTLTGWRHIALQVASLDAEREALAAKGVLFHEAVKPAGGGGRVIYFRDAEDNLLHLVERPTGSLFLRAA